MAFYYTLDFAKRFNDYELSTQDDFRSGDLIFAVLLVDDFTGKEPLGDIKVLMKEGEDEEIKEGYIGVTKAEKNCSGYHFFKKPKNIEVPTVDKYTVKVESDLYFTIEKEKINLPDLKKLDLEFFGKGPKASETSSKLDDISQLSKGDKVEFKNPDDKKETRKITEIKKEENTILWKEELENDYSSAESSIIALKDPVRKIRLKPKPSYVFPENVILIRGHIDPPGFRKIRVAGRIESSTDDRGEFVLYLKEGAYLFNWNKISNGDKNKLMGFLKRKFNVSWKENPEIKKFGDTTIVVYHGEKYAFLELNNEKTGVDLRIEGNRGTDKLIAKMEKGNLNIYEKIIVEVFYEAGETKTIDVTIKEENEKISLGGIRLT